MRRLLTGWIVVLAAPLAAYGQDELRPKEELPKGAEAFLDAVEARKTMADTPAVDGLTDAEKERLIDRNYSETITIYEGLLTDEKRELEALDRRIANNRELVAEYDENLRTAEEKLRHMRLGYDRQILELQGSMQRGEVPRELYEKLVEEKDRQRQGEIAGLQQDVAFYTSEIARLRVVLADLEARRHFLALNSELSKPPRSKREIQAQATPPPRPSVYEQIQNRYENLGRFTDRPIMEAAPHCPYCGNILLGKGGGAAD